MSEENIDSDFSEESLIQKPRPKKQGCCKSFFRCICCCCIKDQVRKIQLEHNKKFWTKIRDRILGKRDFDPVYMTLLHLYGQQHHAIQELESCKISPNFKSSSRDDLEFYVPQIW